MFLVKKEKLQNEMQTFLAKSLFINIIHMNGDVDNYTFLEVCHSVTLVNLCLISSNSLFNVAF